MLVGKRFFPTERIIMTRNVKLSDGWRTRTVDDRPPVPRRWFVLTAKRERIQKRRKERKRKRKEDRANCLRSRSGRWAVDGILLRWVA